MYQKDQNRLSMWRAVYKVLTQHKDVWSANIAFATAYARLEKLITYMEAAGTSQQNPTTGITLDKEGAEEIAIIRMLELAGAAKAYAIDHEHNDLYARVNVTRNGLERLTDNVLRDRLESMMEAIEPIQENLKDAGVTADEIKEAKAAVDRYRELIAAPRTAIAGRKTSTESIPGIKKDVRKVLDQMDGLVIRFKKISTAFVSDYQNARIVVDAGIRHNGDNDKPTI